MDSVVEIVEACRKLSNGDLWLVAMNANIELKKRHVLPGRLPEEIAKESKGGSCAR